MTTKELNAFVNQQHLRGMSDKSIAGSLGMTLECMYRTMAKDDEAGVDEESKKEEEVVKHRIIQED